EQVMEEWTDGPEPSGWFPKTVSASFDASGNRGLSVSTSFAWSISGGVATEQAQYREESRGYYSADNRLMVYQVNRDIKNQSNTNWGAYEVYWYDALGRRVFKRSYQAGGLC